LAESINAETIILAARARVMVGICGSSRLVWISPRMGASLFGISSIEAAVPTISAIT